MENKSSHQHNYWIWFSSCCLAMGFVISIVYIAKLLSQGYSLSPFNDLNFSATNNAGTFLGGILGPLWTVATFFVIYSTFISQNKINELQFKKIYTEQKHVDRQRFETLFYTLIANNFALVQSLFVFTSNERDYFEKYMSHNKVCPVEISGQEIFKCMHDYLESEYKLCTGIYTDTESGKSNEYKHIKDTYARVFDSRFVVVGHYFRNIYNILKFVDHQYEIEHSEDPKNVLLIDEFIEYVSVLSSRMSVYELLSIAYNSLCFENMKNLVVKFKLIENIPVEMFISKSHKDFFDIEFKSKIGKW